MPKRVVLRFVLVSMSALLCSSALLNIYFFQKVRELSSALVASGPLRVGKAVPALTLTKLDGKAAPIDYADADEGTVLYIFRPSCVWCRRNAPSVRALVSQADRRYRFIAICLGDAIEPPAELQANFPIYFLSRQAASQLGFSATPQTLVLSRQGVVRRIWRGAFTGANLSDVENFFGVRLPDRLANSMVE